MEEKLSQILRSKSGFDVFGGAAADAGRSKVKGGVNIVEAPLSKGKSTVSLSAFAFLYSEILQRVEKETRNYEEYREKLSNLGKHVGLRILELYAYREVGSRRENSELGILQFISKTVWKVLFNKPPGELLKSEEGYLLIDKEPVTNIFMSQKKGSNQTGLNPAIFIGGIIEGILQGAQFDTNVRTAFSKDDAENADVIPPTVFIIKFRNAKDVKH